MTSLGLLGSIVALCVVSFALAALVIDRFRRERRRSLLYWGTGLFLVFVAIAEEAIFYAGLWSMPLLQSYLVLSAILVGILSLGTAELLFHDCAKRIWFGFVGLASAAVLVVGFLYPVSPSIVVNGVISGAPPSATTIASSIVTVPCAMLIIVGSLYGVVRQRRLSLLYIAFGAIVFAAAGALYVAAFPVTMYYADFVGVALLFLGFVKVPFVSVKAGTPTSA